MVEDRVTDGERVAQLLASELSGRSDGPLDRFAVVDADPDAEPAPDGTLAFRVAVDGDRVGRVRIYPDGAEIRVEDASDGSENGSLDTGRLVEATRGDGLRAETPIGVSHLDRAPGAGRDRSPLGTRRPRPARRPPA